MAPPLRIPTASEVAAAKRQRERTRLTVPTLAAAQPHASSPSPAPAASSAAASSGAAATDRPQPPHTAGPVGGKGVGGSTAHPPPSSAARGGSTGGTSTQPRAQHGQAHPQRGASGASPATAAASNPNANANANPNPNALIVSQRQRGNPVLKAIRNVQWQYGTTSADYLVTDSACALFLSLRYHLLHPDYLIGRLRELNHHNLLRMVILLVDSEDAERPVLDVTRLAVTYECTLLLTWSVQEVARYLETFRAYAKKPADLIKERSDGAFLSILAECLTTARPVNRTDVATLNAHFGSLRSIMHASAEELSLCPGLGERKVRRLRETFVQPFLSSRIRAAQGGPSNENG